MMLSARCKLEKLFRNRMYGFGLIAFIFTGASSEAGFLHGIITEADLHKHSNTNTLNICNAIPQYSD